MTDEQRAELAARIETEVRREQATDEIAEFIERTLAEAPQLTADQELRLIGVIQDGSPDA